MSDPWEGDSDSQILVSHGSEVTWTWVWVTHGFLEIFEKCFEGQLEGFKKEMFQKRYFPKRKNFENSIFKMFEDLPKKEISFLKPSNWPSKHFSKISKNPWVTCTQVQVTSDPWETSMCESKSPFPQIQVTHELTCGQPCLYLRVATTQ